MPGSQMFTRIVIAWCVLLAAAIGNGALREVLIAPHTSELAARAVSAITLSAAILILSWFLVPWIGPVTSAEALRVGGVWVALTVAFELLGGHYVFGASWTQLFADYNVLAGRIWVLVLVTTMAAPFISVHGHRIPH
jgi:hypothetical protein